MSQPVAVRAERAGPHATDLKRFSCLTCRQRKVKCDRHNPCSNCTKAAQQCNFVPPVRGKPKRRSTPKEGLHAKLRRYEEMLKSYGADIELSDYDHNNMSDVESVSEPDGQMLVQDVGPPKEGRDSLFAFDESKTNLITRNGSTRYFDNGLWPNLGDEFNPLLEDGRSGRLDGVNVRTYDVFNDSLEESSLVLGSISFQKVDLASVYFPSHILQTIFDIYLDRVDPHMKILHLPTFWSALTSALKTPHDMPKSLEAAMFSFCFAAIISLEDDECSSLLGESKLVLTGRYKAAICQALLNANFLKSSSLTTLQAYAMFLTSNGGYYQNNSIYILSGIAVRLARRMGLHRDGTMLELSPFETELRRRLWWHIVHLDWRTSDFSGTKPSTDIFLSDTKKPLNIEDEDIRPDTMHPPPERTGITSGVLCLLRCDLMDFLHKVTPPLSKVVRWDNLTSPNIKITEKDDMINQMEDMLERKYLRYYDPSISLHYFSSIIARSSICKMKLFAHNPRQFANCGTKVPQNSRDIIFANGTKLLEYAILIHSSQILRKYTWQLSSGYLWDTLHYVLIEVRHRKMGPEVDRAWKLVGAVFVNYPQIFVEATDTLYAAIGSWTLRVWDDLVAAKKEDGLPESPVPEFITAIRRCRKSPAETPFKPNGLTDPGRATEALNGHGEAKCLKSNVNPIPFLEPTDMYDFPDLVSYDLEPDEWAQWERLLSGQAF
ncbi:hypothetical protein BP6252_11062 [Coleophoma cylindrospora]|uniref:Zn(2)-C6 fungal-type domain-containing protein n=1 Tax=Coleophoma cylindrospora TaxID=1849047 RepID=A0A3D8QP02_9HELO|nr:hypothetical protein BP6252_11062 [Coleophoma cylindrospora]